MRQHLNLYSQLDRVVEPPFSARQQVMVLAAALVVMAAVAALMWWSNRELIAELTQVQADQRRQAAELEDLQAEKAKKMRIDTVKSELTFLTEDIQFRRQLLANIEPDSSDRQSFAGYLQGLARQHIEGMWFTDIHLLQGGQQLSLAGSTREPEYLPRYLQKLNAEIVFAGHQFRVFRMNAAEDRPGILDFELRAFDAEAIQ